MPDLDQNVAFSVPANAADAAALEQELTTALAFAGVPAPAGPVWTFEGPPEGAFGFGEGLLKFLGDAWKELVKIPGAVTAVAQGMKSYLENRPGSYVTIKHADGSTTVIKGHMTGEEIAQILDKT